MYHVSAQGVDECMINVHHYYYFMLQNQNKCSLCTKHLVTEEHLDDSAVNDCHNINYYTILRSL